MKWHFKTNLFLFKVDIGQLFININVTMNREIENLKLNFVY
jgi:hypothetical protein